MKLLRFSHLNLFFLKFKNLSRAVIARLSPGFGLTGADFGISTVEARCSSLGRGEARPPNWLKKEQRSFRRSSGFGCSASTEEPESRELEEPQVETEQDRETSCFILMNPSLASSARSRLTLREVRG